MTDVEYTAKDYAEILKIMGEKFNEKKPTPEQQKLFKKTQVMYDSEREWDEAEKED